MKLLYLPSESNIGGQVGPRAAFKLMLEKGKLAELEIFSFRVEAKNLQKPEHVWQKVIQNAKELKSDIILFQHIGEFPLPGSVIPALKSLPGRPTICYHEGDVYGRFHKPFTKSMKNMAAESDVVFLVGLGKYAERFLKCGAKCVLYSPSCVDTSRFGSEWKPTIEREVDVVMIASRIVSRFTPLNRLRWGRMAGSFERDQLVRRLGEVFGDRFAIFGHGWDGSIGNRGPISFDEQEKTMRKAWLTISWNHFHNVPYFFSNRLPISLVSGVAHLSNYQPGYELLFRNGEHLVWARSVEEMVDVARALLSEGPDKLIELGRRGRAFALENLTAQVVYKSILERAATYRKNCGCVTNSIEKVIKP